MIKIDYVLSDKDYKFVSNIAIWGDVYKSDVISEALGFVTEARAQEYKDSMPKLSDCVIKRRTAHYTFEAL